MLNGKKAPGKGGDSFKREVMEPGSYPGRLVQLIDLGLQEQRPYLGQPKAPINEVIFTYEFSDEFMKDLEGNVLPDKPRFLSETLPLHNLVAEKAKSTQRYKALDPEEVHDGEFASLLSTPCVITVIIDRYKDKKTGADKVIEKVANISPMRKKEADKLTPLINPTKLFDLDSPDVEVFASLPDWIKDKIRSNLNYNGSVLQGLLKEKPVAVAPKEESPVPSDERPY